VITPCETRRKLSAYLLIFSFIGWISASAFPVFAHGRSAAAHAPGFAVDGRDSQTTGPDATRAEHSESSAQVVEKAESARPAVKKKPFPWLGVMLSAAIIGGLVYFIFIVKHTLQVNTTPAGAKIYLDGHDTGKVSPCQLAPSLGAHTVKAVLEGYADAEEEVVVKNGKNSLTIPLDIGTFELTAPAANANVQREAPCLLRWDSTAMSAQFARPASNKAFGVTKVNLELYQQGARVSDIALGVPNSGSYIWNVPAATSEGHDFKVVISCSDLPDARGLSPAFNLLGFKEDFTDNKADFWLPDNGADWRADGGYYSASKANGSPAVGVYDFFYGETSYTVESRMRWSEFSGNSGAPLFIMLGTSNSLTTNSGYVLGYAMDGTVSVYEVANFNLQVPPPGSPDLFYSGSSGAVNSGLNSWNTVRIVRNETSYAFYINGILVYTLVDATYNPPYVMIGFAGAGTRAACDFDYVYMTVTPKNQTGR
jgi:hypothetical protein